VVATSREASVDQSNGFIWRDPVSEVIWLRTGLRCRWGAGWDRVRVRSRSLGMTGRAAQPVCLLYYVVGTKANDGLNRR